MSNQTRNWSNYMTPNDVVLDKKLSEAEKIRILKEWALDEELKAVADEENMPRQDHETPNRLHAVLEALLSLGVEFDPHGNGPHK